MPLARATVVPCADLRERATPHCARHVAGIAQGSYTRASRVRARRPMERRPPAGSVMQWSAAGETPALHSLALRSLPVKPQEALFGRDAEAHGEAVVAGAAVHVEAVCAVRPEAVIGNLTERAHDGQR